MFDRWRVAVVVVAGAVSASAYGVGGAPPASADCSGPSVSISRGVVAPGEQVVVDGQAFGTACNDTGGPGPALGSPLRGITVAFEQEGRSVPIGTCRPEGCSTTRMVDAGEDYRIRFATRIPETAHAGPAAIVVNGGLPLRVAIEGAPVAAVPVTGYCPPPTDDGGWSPVGVAVGAFGVGAFFAVAAGRARRHARRAT